MKNIAFELTEREAYRIMQDLILQLTDSVDPIYITIPESYVVGVDNERLDT